jgi:ferredoxin-NADP reductase/DMSO/TMAO reductase YedYZ heme-binding membrane subunit
VADLKVRPAKKSCWKTATISACAAVALVVVVTQAHYATTSHAQLDPVRWWYMARASGLAAWVVLTASVVAGLLMSVRLAQGNTRRCMQRFHACVGAFAVIFTVTHLVCACNAPQLQVGIVQLLIPFTKPNNPTAQAAGVIAFYLLTTVVLTSWARVILPWRWWRQMHLLSVPLWALSTVHTALAGTDLIDPVTYWGGVTVTSMVGALVAFRLVTTRWTSAGAALGARRPPAAALAVADAHPQPCWSSGSPTAATPMDAGMRLVISQVTMEAENVLSFRLTAADGAALPSWEPGAHIELVLPSGRRRQYSLCGDPHDTHTYRIAVLRVPTGRGGSVELHAIARAGQLITVHGPRNHFPLVPSPAYLFIAGGIGITPLMAMAARVASMGCPWKLAYVGRCRASMAFINEVTALGTSQVEVLPHEERGRPDLDAVVDAAPSGTTIYCCGPDRMLQAVQQRVATRPDLSLHYERFTGATAAGGTAFQVKLQRSRHVLDVPDNRTVLQAVRDVVPGISVGCEQGICGACRAIILAGEADHRDALLNDTERAAGAMLLCVSRARTKKLTLDL